MEIKIKVLGAVSSNDGQNQIQVGIDPANKDVYILLDIDNEPTLLKLSRDASHELAVLLTIANEIFEDTAE